MNTKTIAFSMPALLALLFGALIMSAGCSSSSGQSPSSTTTDALTGSWTLTVTTNPAATYGQGVWGQTLVLTQSGSGLTGQASTGLTLNSQTCCAGLIENFTGTVDGLSVSMSRTDQGNPTAGFEAQYTGTVSADGTSMSGTGTDNNPGGGDNQFTWVAQKQ